MIEAQPVKPALPVPPAAGRPSKGSPGRGEASCSSSRLEPGEQAARHSYNAFLGSLWSLILLSLFLLLLLLLLLRFLILTLSSSFLLLFLLPPRTHVGTPPCRRGLDRTAGVQNKPSWDASRCHHHAPADRPGQHPAPKTQSRPRRPRKVRRIAGYGSCRPSVFVENR